MQIGIDLGGTKIEAALLEPGGAIRWRRRIATPAEGYAATIAAVAGLVAEARQEGGRDGTVGIGIPGSPSPADGLIRNANSVSLNGQPLAADLEAALGCPVRIANDADCFALSEATDGAGKGAASLFGVILGTGVGGGLVLDGRRVQGINRIVGEWGHNPMPGGDEGRRCWCGRLDCIETYLSGPALESEYDAKRRVDAAEIARLASVGDDRAAQAVLERYAARLARALATIINIVDPAVIVLGGGLSRIATLYDRVPPLWPEWVFSDTISTRLLPPVHGDSGGVRGAAWLWPAAGEPVS